MAEAADVMTAQGELGTDHPYLVGLLPALRQLDRRIARAVVIAEQGFGPAAAVDRLRGLRLTSDDVTRLLGREPGVPLFRTADLPSDGESDLSTLVPQFAWLAREFDLSDFDLNVVLIALAPEFDLRYERFYAYLQDDVTRKRPSVDLVLNLLCADVSVRLTARRHFSPDAPLLRHGLVRLLSVPPRVDAPLLVQAIYLDDQISDLLLGQGNIDRRLTPFCQLVPPSEISDGATVYADQADALRLLFARAQETGQPLRVALAGPPGIGKRDLVMAVARDVEKPVLVARLSHARRSGLELSMALMLVFREAWLQDAILFLDEIDSLVSLGDSSRADPRHLVTETLADSSGTVILATNGPWTSGEDRATGVISFPLSLPSAAQRRVLWTRHLETAGLEARPEDLDVTAACFRLTPAQIFEAAAIAPGLAQLQAARQLPAGMNQSGEAQPNTVDLAREVLFAAARAQTGHELASLARKVEPLATWDDLVLPADSVAQLRELAQRVVYRDLVMTGWGFERKLSQGKGTTALFAGPSGTGKTMAVEVVAGELGLDLYKIELASVVSKYIGETEKNLDRIFAAAANANAILFFDEADALFGKRSEVHDSHDRYANLEISYLLQRMELFDGVAILATNLRQNLDEAFVRRLAFTIHFPFPDEATRRAIWTKIWPAATPLAPDLDLDFLSSQFKLSGGNIKNVAVTAAFLAAADGQVVTMAHVVQGVRREFLKLGKSLSDSESAEHVVAAEQHARRRIAGERT